MDKLPIVINHDSNWVNGYLYQEDDSWYVEFDDPVPANMMLNAGYIPQEGYMKGNTKFIKKAEIIALSMDITKEFIDAQSEENQKLGNPKFREALEEGHKHARVTKQDLEPISHSDEL